MSTELISGSELDDLWHWLRTTGWRVSAEGADTVWLRDQHQITVRATPIGGQQAARQAGMRRPAAPHIGAHRALRGVFLIED